MRVVQLIKENRPFFVPYALVLLILGVLQILYGRTALFTFVNAHYNDQADWFFRYMTYVGDGIFYDAIIILLLFVRFRYALVALVSFALSGISVQLLKRFVFTDSFRPARFYENSEVSIRIIDGLQMYSNNSFPSGHTTTAFSMFCLLSLISREKKWGYLFFVLAFWTAYSRVYLSQHFVADV